MVASMGLQFEDDDAGRERVMEQQPDPVEHALKFGRFRLYRRQRMLLDGDKPARLGSRAIDILIALVERAGEIVSKNELTAFAWPNMSVEDSNLRVHIAAIRKILGEGLGDLRYIQSVPGRGYRFVAPVNRSNSASRSSYPQRVRPRDLPAPLTRIVGREDVIDALMLQVSSRRLVTIVGPGGVGKSMVALAVAEGLAGNYGDGARFVELSSIVDPALVPSAVAAAVGISTLSVDAISSLVAFLNSKQLLIVLDNCEHVIVAVAHLVETILRLTPGTHVVATSREPLSVAGEYVHRLAPLRTPPLNAAVMTAAQALSSPAVQLFVERAASSLETFELRDADADAVVEICRRLDGLPLAIELAAARVDVFGVKDLVNRLDDRFLLVTQGRRTAEVRHQSLRAMLDWSFERLTRVEQTVLRRLAMIRGPFTLATAVAIADIDGTGTGEVTNAIVSLATKSLIATDINGPAVRYRLLYITRMYALEQLAEHEETHVTARRHAEHYRTLLDFAQTDWETMARPEWLAAYGYMIDDVRAALDWAYSDAGDPEVGAALTGALLPFGFQLSLVGEIRKRTVQALESLAAASSPQILFESRLNAMLGSLMYNMDGDETGARAALKRAIVLAEQLGNPKYLIAPQVNYSTAEVEWGNYRAAIAAADQVSDIARRTDDPLAILIADRVAAQAHHFFGNYRRARILAERVISHPAKSIPLVYSQTSMDRRVLMRAVLAQILWLEGYPDQAMLMLEECLVAAAEGSPYELCYAIGVAGCPIALWLGAEELAQDLTARLLEISRRYMLNRWIAAGLAYKLVLDHRGRRQSGVTAFRDAIRRLGRMNNFQLDILATICEDVVDPEMIERAKSGAAGWCAPEILRAAGELVLRTEGVAGANSAEALFRRSLHVARNQGALSWELRATTSMARLRQRQGRYAEAHDDLASVSGRFAEGHDTADLQAARRLLKALDTLSA
jgi:predicted ATPase